MHRIYLAFLCFFRILFGKQLPGEVLPPAPEPPKQLAAKTAAGEFTLEDLKEQLASMKKMGPLESILDLLPKGATKALKGPDSVDEKALVRTTAMIDGFSS